MAEEESEGTRWDRVRATLGRVGVLIHAVAVLALPCLIQAFAAGEPSAAKGLGVAAAVSLGLGQGLYWLGRSTRAKAVSGHVVALGWLVIALLAAIPFGWVDGYGGPVDWFFEGMSGATSTGLSVASDATTLPAAIQLWRTLLEWSGGLGFAVLTLALIEPTEEGRYMYFAEARSASFGDVQDTAQQLLVIYAGCSVLAVLALFATGIELWEALNHGLVAIGTGGFSVTADSYGSYGVATKIVTMVVMFVGATSFVVPHRIFYERAPSELWKNRQLPVLVAIWTIGAVVLGLTEAEGWEALDVVFDWTSALTTTGFAARPPAGAPDALLLWFIVAMIIGGCAGSTAGGIKVGRVRAALLSTVRRLGRIRRGKEMAEPEEGDVALVRAARHSALSHVALVLGTWWIGALALAGTLPGDAPADHVLFETASAIGGVGLSTGLTADTLPWTSKLVLTVLMWLGRLEIVPVLIFAWRLTVAPARSDQDG